MEAPHCFISYAREDNDRVQPIVQLIEANGWSVFWDRNIPAGLTWRGYIGKALDEAKCVIVVWSRNSVTSEFVQEEADDGRDRKILIPIRVSTMSGHRLDFGPFSMKTSLIGEGNSIIREPGV